jgi:O-antigen biosynthesis protein
LPQVLFCDWELPDPTRDVGSFRATSLFRLFKSLGYGVSFLPANRHPDPPLLEPLQQQGVCVFCWPEIQRLEQVFREYGKYFDVVVVSRVNVGEACFQLARDFCPRAHLMYDTVGLHFLRAQRQAELADDDLRAKTAASKHQELGFINGADTTLVVSPEEVEVLCQEAPQARVRIVGNFREPLSFDAARQAVAECLAEGKRSAGPITATSRARIESAAAPSPHHLPQGAGRPALNRLTHVER